MHRPKKPPEEEDANEWDAALMWEGESRKSLFFSSWVSQITEQTVFHRLCRAYLFCIFEFLKKYYFDFFCQSTVTRKVRHHPAIKKDRHRRDSFLKGV